MLGVLAFRKLGGCWKRLPPAVMLSLQRFGLEYLQGRDRQRHRRSLLTTLLFALAGMVMLPAPPALAEVFDRVVFPSGADGWDITFHPTNQNYAFFARHRDRTLGCLYRLDPDGNGPIEQGDGCFNNGAYTLDIGGNVGQKSSVWVTSDGNTAYIPRNHTNNGGTSIAKVDISDPDPTQWTVGTAVNFTTNMNYYSNSVMVNDVLWAVSGSGILKYDTTTQQASTLAKSMWAYANIYHAGGKIWSVASNLSLVCVDPSNGQFCSTGSFTNGAGASLGGLGGSIGHMAEYRNTDGSFGGFCSDQTCVNADGATDNSMVMPTGPTGSVGSWRNYGLFHVSDQHLLIRHQSLSTPQTYTCWDFTTQAVCAGSKFTQSTNNSFPGRAYTVVQDAWNSNCFWTNSDDRIIGAWDVDHTGGFATSGGECDLTFVATTVTLTYDPQGGTGQPGNQTGNASSNVTVSSTAPTRDGYTFVKWNTAADGSGTDYAGGATYTLPNNGTATLYAQWQINTVTLTYDPQGGTGQPGNQTGNAASNVTVSSTAPTRDGYTFVKWNTAADGSGTDYAGGATYTLPNSGTATLYAQWQINTVTLTYDPQGGTGQPGNQTGNATSNVTVSSTVPTRAGYTFTGWDTVADGSGTDYAGGATYTLPNSGTVTLYAQWTVDAASNRQGAANQGGVTPAVPIPILDRLGLLLVLVSLLLAVLGIRRLV